MWCTVTRYGSRSESLLWSQPLSLVSTLTQCPQKPSSLSVHRHSSLLKEHPKKQVQCRASQQQPPQALHQACKYGMQKVGCTPCCLHSCAKAASSHKQLVLSSAATPCRCTSAAWMPPTMNSVCTPAAAALQTNTDADTHSAACQHSQTQQVDERGSPSNVCAAPPTPRGCDNDPHCRVPACRSPRYVMLQRVPDGQPLLLAAAGPHTAPASKLLCCCINEGVGLAHELHTPAQLCVVLGECAWHGDQARAVHCDLCAAHQHSHGSSSASATA